jgi:hypothetical protein
MNKLTVLAVCTGLLATASVRADLIGHIYLQSTLNQDYVTVRPGDTLNLWTEVLTESIDMSMLTYSIELPTNDWTLLSRNYGDQGWIAADGVYDASAPLQGDLPLVIAEDLGLSGYTDYAPTVPDFWLSTVSEAFVASQGSYPYVPVGNHEGRVEDFSVRVPNLPNGDYTITFGWDLSVPLNPLPALYATDLDLMPIATPAEISWTSFTVRVDATIPEPCALPLFLLGGLALLGRRRRPG